MLDFAHLFMWICESFQCEAFNMNDGNMTRLFFLVYFHLLKTGEMYKYSHEHDQSHHTKQITADKTNE